MIIYVMGKYYLVACATSRIFYPQDRYKVTRAPFIYDNTKKNTKCLKYLKNLRDEYCCRMGLHCRIYKNHQHKMIRHTKLIDHILRLPSLDLTLQYVYGAFMTPHAQILITVTLIPILRNFIKVDRTCIEFVSTIKQLRNCTIQPICILS